MQTHKVVMPSYKTNDPKGWGGDPKRGAAVGRGQFTGTYDGKPITLICVPLDSGGYDKNGTYWGIGNPLYWAASQDGNIDMTFRAIDRNDAKKHVRSKYPEAIFYR